MPEHLTSADVAAIRDRHAETVTYIATMFADRSHTPPPAYLEETVGDVAVLLAENERLRALIDDPAHEVTVRQGACGWQWECVCGDSEDDLLDAFTAELAAREHIDDAS